MKNSILYGILSILFIADLILVARDEFHFLRFFTKPFLVPLIATIYLSGINKKEELNSWFLSGLIFSFLGDTFLLFKWGFLPGLGSFLFAHVLYILSFIKLRAAKMLFSIPFILLYLIFLIYFLHPYLGEMEIPVIVYGITISIMAYFSLRSKNKWLIAGAFLFVISDSLLSFNMFVNYSAITEQFVMATYVFAQLFLVRGMIFRKQI